MEITLTEINRLLAANKFLEFVKLCWPVVCSDKFVPGYHVEAICEHLQALAEHKISRLCINVGVRHSKSLLVSVFFPVWLWVRNPATRIITSTYSQVLTVRDAVRSRQLLESKLFRDHFGTIQLTDDQSRKDFYSNTSKGHRLSVSIGSRTAGFDADVILADDIHDFATRTSEAERNKAIDYFETALCSRLVYTGQEGIVLAGHRVHEDDVSARLRNKYGDDGTWTWLVLPEEYTPTFSTWYNGTGWRDKRTEGELLWPERFTPDVIQQERKRYRHEYSAIFQQEPTPQEGTLFKPDWFRTYTETETHYTLNGKAYPKDRACRIATCDTAISTSETADFTVCQVWDILGTNLILVDQLRGRFDGNQIVPRIAAFYQKHQPQFLAVETEFVGRFVLDQLRARNITVKAFDARKHGPKETRAIAAEVRSEAGQVFLPADKPWVSDWMKEILSFPNGKNDDCVDCMSMACLLAERYETIIPKELTPEEIEQQRKQQEAERISRIMNDVPVPFRRFGRFHTK